MWYCDGCVDLSSCVDTIASRGVDFWRMCHIVYYYRIDEGGYTWTFERSHCRGYGDREHEWIVYQLFTVWLRCQCLICLVSVVNIRWNSVYVGVCYPHIGICDDYHRTSCRRDRSSWYRYRIFSEGEWLVDDGVAVALLHVCVHPYTAVVSN